MLVRKKYPEEVCKKHWNLWDKHKSGQMEEKDNCQRNRKLRKNGNKTMKYLQRKAERKFNLRDGKMQLKQQEMGNQKEMGFQKEMQLEAIRNKI